MIGARLAQTLVRLSTPFLGASRAERAVAQGYAVVYLVFYYLSAQYARAALGVVWLVLTPLLFLAVYFPVLTYVFKAPGSEDPKDYAFFIIAGFLPWSAFADGFGQGAASVTAQASIVRHAPIPPSLLPAIRVSAAFTGLFMGLGIFVVALTVTGRSPGFRLLLLPLAFALLYIFTLGLAWLASSVVVFLRDLLQLLPTILMVEFFACPIVYHPNDAQGMLGLVVRWNPFTPFLALFRGALAPTAEFAWGDLAMAALWASLALVLGLGTFRRLEDGFSDAL